MSNTNEAVRQLISALENNPGRWAIKTLPDGHRLTTSVHHYGDSLHIRIDLGYGRMANSPQLSINEHYIELSGQDACALDLACKQWHIEHADVEQKLTDECLERLAQVDLLCTP